MEAHPLFFAFWTVAGLCLFFNFGVSFEENYDSFVDDPSVLHTYNRFAEIEQQCKPFLPSASDLNPDDTRGYRLKKELTFFNGDWDQEIGGSVLMPFDDSDLPKNNSAFTSPLKLVNFHVTDVNPVHQWKNIISLIGVLSIGIIRNSSFSLDWRSKFYRMPGLSVQSILFEGVYIESNENGGERLLCMLGNSTLLYNKRNNDSWDLAKGYWSNYVHKPSHMQDDQILLLLRYPQTFNLTRRVIRGEMRSLNDQSSLKYFGRVHLTSQLGRHSKYQFNPEMFKSITCSPYLYQEELMEDGAIMFNGSNFCKQLGYISQQVFSAVPNWKLGGRSLYPGKLGPFQLEKEIRYVDWSYNNVRLIMQDINCEEENDENDFGIARVSAVLRAIPAPSDNHLPSKTRTGLSVMTLSVEGKWDQSSGQLCMVGCLGVVDSGLEGCDYQISLYFPRAFSIKQRSMIVGSISSIKNEKDSSLPIIFDAVLNPRLLEDEFPKYITSYLSYSYSKIDQADALRRRKQPSKFCTFVKQFLLKYPSLDDRDELLESLKFLSDELEIHAYAVSDTLSSGRNSSICIEIIVLSLGPMFGSYQPWLRKSYPPLFAQASISKTQLLNVSMHLLFAKAPFSPTATSFHNVSELYLEGLYDPLVGEMYLVGCRKVMLESINLERGLDCLIEVKIEYPPVTAAWLINPKAKITVTSQREEDDPLYFSSISLQTLTLRYEKHLDVSFRRDFEEILRNLVAFHGNCMHIVPIPSHEE